MLHRLIASLSLAGYLLAMLLAAGSHDHRCGDGTCCAPAGHHEHHARCHHHGHGHHHGCAVPGHSHSDRKLPAPLHDDDCAACRFLAQKPFSAPVVAAVTVSEPVAAAAAVVVPVVDAPSLLSPCSRAPPCG
ncbi:MAG: hypothetical protein ACREJB_02035, partial [Planctomycetaceae bacterium]